MEKKTFLLSIAGFAFLIVYIVRCIFVLIQCTSPCNSSSIKPRTDPSSLKGDKSAVFQLYVFLLVYQAFIYQY